MGKSRESFSRSIMKIALINPIEASKYKVANHFILNLEKGLKKLDVAVERFDITLIDESVLNKIKESRPDLLLTFFVYGKNSDLLFENLNIPTLYYSIDSPEYFIDSIKDLNYFVSLRDPHSCQIARNMGLKNVLLLPHAADNDFSVPISQERPYDIVFFGTALPLNIGESLLIDYPVPIQEAFLRAIDLNFSNPFTSHYDSMLDSLKMDSRINRDMLQNIDLSKLLQMVEMRIRAKDKIDLLSAFKEHTVHIFGSGVYTTEWKDSLKGNFVFHPEISFDEVLKIMAQSKIILNSVPTIRFGGHERLYYAYQMGALPFTTFTPYVDREFKPGENILVYYPPYYNDLDKMASAVLNDESKRKMMVESGRAIVQKKHTWDNRALELITQLKQFEPFSSSNLVP